MTRDELEDLRIKYVEARNLFETNRLTIERGDEAKEKTGSLAGALNRARSAYLDAAAETPLPDVDTPEQPPQACEGEQALQQAATPEQMAEIAKTPEYAESLKELGLPNSFEIDDHGNVVAAGISNGSTETM